MLRQDPFIIRDLNGKILGSIKEFWNDEDESYHDYKCNDPIFPRHEGKMHGEVHTWNLNDK